MSTSIRPLEVAKPVPAPGEVALTTRLLVGWGLGSFTTSVLVNSTGLLHLRFMTDSLGIAAALAGTLAAVAKIYDAVTDPLMGGISDHTRSRWGPRRPYLLAGAVLCALSMLLLFRPPAVTGSALVGYMLFALLFFSTAYTVFRIPYLAMGSDLTRTFDERSRLIACNVQGSAMGSLVATTLAPFLLAEWGSDRQAHADVVGVLALLIVLAGIGCFYATGEASRLRVDSDGGASGLRAYLGALRENRPFLILVTFKTVAFTGMTIHLIAVPYFTRHALHVSDRWLGTVFLVQTIAMLISQIGWRHVARAWGRRRTALASTWLLVCVLVSWLSLRYVPRPELVILVLAALQGVAGGGMFFSTHTMLPDTMEYDRMKTGRRREGLLAGAFVMVEKITSAIAIVAFGVLVSAFGYVSSADVRVTQSSETQLGIALALSVIPAALVLAATMLLRGYDLTEEKLSAARRLRDAGETR
jgi:Na+/melibiose symporter-like transporter